MNILDRFEESIAQILEGSIGRIMRSPVQPAEIRPKLERAMLSQQVISVGGTMVPNVYRVAMNPADLARFSDYLSSVCEDMERWLTDIAAERGLIMVDRPSVQIEPDESVRRRTIHVTATVHSRQPHGRPTRTSHTEIFQPVRDSTQPFRLRLLSGPGRGEEFTLDRGPLTVGRASDNDVILAGADVSRHHARIEANGDRIAFGSITAEWVAGDRTVP